MRVNELVIEITRRCNIACQHCLRGEPENKDISNETIDKLLDGIDTIGMITFTGGEPTLAVDRIRYVYDQIVARNIELHGFYIVTNGKIASKELMHVLIDLYALIDYLDEGCATFTVSQDQYHEDEVDPSDAIRLYGALRFFDPNHRKDKLKMLINEGRAVDSGLGERDALIDPIVIEEDDEGNPESIEGTVYINALGDVVPSCDMSYQSQAESKLGNIHDKPLSAIIAAQVSTVNA